MENVRSNIKCSFKCNRWLSTSEDDQQVIRELPAIIQGKEPLPGNDEIAICKVDIVFLCFGYNDLYDVGEVKVARSGFDNFLEGLALQHSHILTPYEAPIIV